MSDDTSVFFNFVTTNYFYRELNLKFFVDGMTGSDGDTYDLLFYRSMPSSIYSVLDTDGCMSDNESPSKGLVLLNTKVLQSSTDTTNSTGTSSSSSSNGVKANVHLLWQDTVNNNGFTISVVEDSGITVNADDSETTLQGMILRHNKTKYVLAYSRLTEPITVSKPIVLPFTGALVKVGNCN